MTRERDDIRSFASAPLAASLSRHPEKKPSGIPVTVVGDHGAVVSIGFQYRLSPDAGRDPAAPEKFAPDQMSSCSHVEREVDVAMVLLNNSGVGGAERRFAQVYEALRLRGVPIALVINGSLRDRLVGTGVLQAAESGGLVIKEPFGRLAQILCPPRHDLVPRAEATSVLARLKAGLVFALRKLDYVFGSLRVGWWLWRRKPKVMHLILGGAYVALPWQAMGLAPPAVMSVVCPSLREMVGAALGLRLYRWALRQASLVDALTDSVRGAVQREGVPPERVLVSAGSCVDTVRFHPAPIKQPWVVFTGRLVEDKNPVLFVQACALVRRRLGTKLPALRFFLLGDGPLRETVKAQARQHGLESCLEIGWRDHVETILEQTLVFVSLQRTDNYPSQALLEAMASGAAVVATDVGLTRKLVDQTVGLVVDPTPESVARAVVSLLNDPAHAEAMGLRGRTRVVQEHSLDAYLDYLESLYARVGGDRVLATGGAKTSRCFS
jgi:glycosyltransferase involved in cell wall biosynthesis